jgi:hypothetical protein
MSENHVSTSLYALHPRKWQSAGKIIVLCILIFTLLNGGWEDKRLTDASIL